MRGGAKSGSCLKNHFTMTKKKWSPRPGPIAILFAIALAYGVACNRHARKGASGTDTPGSGVIASDSVSAGLPTGKEGIRYAQGFSIVHYNRFRVVRVLNRFVDNTDTLIYLLVERGDPVPRGFPGAQVIRTPVQTIIGMSSMHVALADFAGVAGRITGLGSLDYVSSPEVRKNIAAGNTVQTGLDASMNNELILTMHPGVLIAMGNPEAGFGRYKTLIDAGVPVLLNTEWLESTPLGRAEWVKLIGALVDKEAFVDKKFDSIAEVYNNLAKLAATTTDRPHVIIGMPYKGSWFTPAGGSYMAQLLRDAGAGYNWFDSKGTGS